MSSTDVLRPSPPEVSGATLAADVPDNLLNQLMDQHDAEQQLQNLQLQSGSGSQETGTEAAIPLQQGSKTGRHLLGWTLCSVRVNAKTLGAHTAPPLLLRFNEH